MPYSPLKAIPSHATRGPGWGKLTTDKFDQAIKLVKSSENSFTPMVERLEFSSLLLFQVNIWMNLWAKQFCRNSLTQLQWSISCNQMKLQLELAVLFYATKRGDAQRWKKSWKTEVNVKPIKHRNTAEFYRSYRTEKQRKTEARSKIEWET